jgi:ABC-type Zn uptake system ZnuABC Zn-binding protein ZnuA
MKASTFVFVICGAILSVLASALPTPLAGAEEPLAVCATIPDLGDLTREVGGDQVSVTSFTPPRGDAHFLEARPGFIKALSKADLFVVNGLELEVGWVPVLLQGARNGKILPGNPGYLDASRVIEPEQIPQTPMDRSMGDVHPYGNPHYLVDPLNGLRVAELIRDALIAARPAKDKLFRERFNSFQGRLLSALVGAPLAKKYDARKLAILYERGRLESFLKEQGDDKQLGGWLGQMLPHRGLRVATEHNLWVYFAKRYGIEVVGYMEPKPGVPPTTRHLRELIEKMKALGVKLILALPYYDSQYGRFVSEQTGAKVLPMAHQVGSRPGADDYLKTCGYNVKMIVEALGAGREVRG